MRAGKREDRCVCVEVFLVTLGPCSLLVTGGHLCAVLWSSAEAQVTGRAEISVRIKIMKWIQKPFGVTLLQTVNVLFLWTETLSMTECLVAFLAKL